MTKNFYDKMYDPDTINYGHTSGQDQADPTEREAIVWRDLLEVINRVALTKESELLEVGAAFGFNHKIHKNYIGCEYSDTAVDLCKKRFGSVANIVQGDATDLKFENERFDFIFSYATLEHIPDIEKALLEIDRVLKYGGLLYLAPAWNCRTYRVKKLDCIPYNHLGFFEKIEKFFIPLYDSLLFRFALAFPLRIFDETRHKNYQLRVKKLKPNFDLIKKWGHQSDDDAFVSLDAHSAMIWFRCRGYKIISNPSILSRVFCRGKPILLQKVNNL